MHSIESVTKTIIKVMFNHPVILSKYNTQTESEPAENKIIGRGKLIAGAFLKDA